MARPCSEGTQKGTSNTRIRDIKLVSAFPFLGLLGSKLSIPPPSPPAVPTSTAAHHSVYPRVRMAVRGSPPTTPSCLLQTQTQSPPSSEHVEGAASSPSHPRPHSARPPPPPTHAGSPHRNCQGPGSLRCSPGTPPSPASAGLQNTHPSRPPAPQASSPGVPSAPPCP